MSTFKNTIHDSFGSDYDSKSVELDTGTDGKIYYPILDTATMLSETMEQAQLTDSENDTLADKFERYVDWFEFLSGDDSLSWFELGQQFMRFIGFHDQSRGNTYNNENDLSSDFVYEFWTENENTSDWICNEVEELSLIHI